MANENDKIISDGNERHKEQVSLSVQKEDNVKQHCIVNKQNFETSSGCSFSNENEKIFEFSKSINIINDSILAFCCEISANNNITETVMQRLIEKITKNITNVIVTEIRNQYSNYNFQLNKQMDEFLTFCANPFENVKTRHLLLKCEELNCFRIQIRQPVHWKFLLQFPNTT